MTIIYKSFVKIFVKILIRLILVSFDHYRLINVYQIIKEKDAEILYRENGIRSCKLSQRFRLTPKVEKVIAIEECKV